MKNNKRFLFPFACVCVLASQIIPLITYHKTLKLSSAATTKNSAVVPFLSPSRALLLSLLLWNNCSTNLLLRKLKKKTKTQTISHKTRRRRHLVLRTHPKTVTRAHPKCVPKRQKKNNNRASETHNNCNCQKSVRTVETQVRD